MLLSLHPLLGLASVLVLAFARVTGAAGEFAVYWGQNGNGGQKELRHYCDNGISAGTIIVSFLTGFTAPFTTISESDINTASTEMAAIGADVTYCQQQGKKVLLSIGGDRFAPASTGWTSAEDAVKSAQLTYETFGQAGEKNAASPFGAGVFDGFDLDLEAVIPFIYEFAAELRKGTKWLTAAPQCQIPDKYQSAFLDGSDGKPAVPMDALYIQFYNTEYCATYMYKTPTGDDSPEYLGFNLDAWNEWGLNSPNPGVQLVVGTPGAPGAANGYASVDLLQEIVDWALENVSLYAGIMVWDVSFMQSPDGLGLDCPIFHGVNSSPQQIQPPVEPSADTSQGSSVVATAPANATTASQQQSDNTSVSALPYVDPTTATTASQEQVANPSGSALPYVESGLSTITSTTTTTDTSTLAATVLVPSGKSIINPSIDTTAPTQQHNTADYGQDNCFSGATEPTAPGKQWQQCGGKCWLGPTTCDSGLTCTVVTEWWSDCRKGGASKREEGVQKEQRATNTRLNFEAKSERGRLVALAYRA